MFSKKYMIGGSLIGLGAVGVYLSTFPGYWGFLIAFGVMAILGEVTYWPVLLKAIRLLGDEKTQGRMFGFLEMGRGIAHVVLLSGTLNPLGSKSVSRCSNPHKDRRSSPEAPQTPRRAFHTSHG